MRRSDNTVWVPAKRFGWGWGFPITWQGWFFLLAWIAGLVLGPGLVPILRKPPLSWAFGFAMVAFLLTVCWIKGDKPKWRWGD